MLSWRLTLLGGFELSAADGRRVALKSRKGAALLAWLALQPKRCGSRTALAALLWEHAGEEAARVSLRQLLTALRRPLPDVDGSLIETDGDVVRLPAGMNVDALDFLEAAERRAPDAGALYGGDLLAGLTLKEAPAFEEWLALERSHLRGLAIGALERQVEASIAAGGAGDEQAALRLLALEPLHERGHRALMRLQVRQGRPAAALKTYQTLAAQLQSELGVQPEPETRALYDEVRARRGAPRQAQAPVLAAIGVPDAAPDSERSETATSPAVPGAPPRPSAPLRPKRRSLWRVGALVAVLAGALVAGATAVLNPPPSPPVVDRLFQLAADPALEQRPSISPDGQRVVYTARLADKGNVDLYLMTVGDPTPLRLSRDPAIDDNAAWTPDGSAVAFTRAPKDGRTPCQILVMTVPNGAEREVGRCRSALTSRLSWFPDGRTLAFSDAPKRGATSVIYKLDSTTAEAVPLSHPPPSISGDGEPVVSVDGRNLAFIRTAAWQSTELVVQDLRTGQERTLTHDGKTIWGLAWSKRDRGVVFSSDRAGDTGLWWISTDGRRLERLSAGAMEYRALSHAREKDRLVFEVLRDHASFFEVPRDGTPAVQPRPIENLKTGLFDRFYWETKDGKAVFTSVRSGDEQLWTAERGKPPRQLTRSQDWFYQEPTWSPDGRWIAFIGVSKGRADLYLIDGQGGGLKRLTDDDAVQQSPAWSPDGRFLYVGSRRSGAWRIWRVDPFSARAKAQPVTDDGPRTARVSADGRFLYYTRDGEPGVRRRALSPDGARTVGPEETVVADVHPSDWRNWWLADGAVIYAKRGGGDPAGVIRRHDLATGAERDLADATDLLWSASFWARTDGSLVLTRRDLQIDLSGIDFH